MENDSLLYGLENSLKFFSSQNCWQGGHILIPLKPQEQGRNRETPIGREKDGSERQAMKSCSGTLGVANLKNTKTNSQIPQT